MRHLFGVSCLRKCYSWSPTSAYTSRWANDRSSANKGKKVTLGNNDSAKRLQRVIVAGSPAMSI